MSKNKKDHITGITVKTLDGGVIFIDSSGITTNVETLNSEMVDALSCILNVRRAYNDGSMDIIRYPNEMRILPGNYYDGVVCKARWLKSGKLSKPTTLKRKSPLMYLDTVPKIMSVDTRNFFFCLLYTSPSPRDRTRSRMPSSA